MYLGILFGIYAILGISLNLIVGYTGLLSITHAAFYGIGAYATAILMTSFGINFFISIIIGIAIVAIISFLIGLVLNKFNGDYYAIVSMGFGVIIFSILLNWQKLTNGPLGISGIPKPELFGIDFSSTFSFLILVFVFLILIYFIGQFISNSSFGRVLKAIREDEKVIQVFGYNTLYFKLTVFVISATMASIAGSLLASYITFIDPSLFTLMESVFILAIIILGGLANNKGAVLGALFLILLPEALSFIGLPTDTAAQMRQVIYGLILVFLMLYKPQGLLGEYKL